MCRSLDACKKSQAHVDVHLYFHRISVATCLDLEVINLINLVTNL